MHRPYWKQFPVGGVFMYKFLKYSWICVLVLWMFILGGLLSDLYSLRHDFVRLHVISHANTQTDKKELQSVLRATAEWINRQIDGMDSSANVMSVLSCQIYNIQKVADSALMAGDSKNRTTVSLEREYFRGMEYDAFSLPSGVYPTLKICIGDARGYEHPCVVFPIMCQSKTNSFSQVLGRDYGISAGLLKTVFHQDIFSLRFAMLDTIGMAEKFFLRK